MAKQKSETQLRHAYEKAEMELKDARFWHRDAEIIRKLERKFYFAKKAFEPYLEKYLQEKAEFEAEMKASAAKSKAIIDAMSPEEREQFHKACERFADEEVSSQFNNWLEFTRQNLNNK